MWKYSGCAQYEGGDTVSSSASYAFAQFRMEFSSNRSDDVWGIILGEATDKKHLITMRSSDARRDHSIIPNSSLR